jgi:uncharacterized membrane protein
MNRFQRNQWIVKIAITVGIMVGLLLGIASESTQNKYPYSNTVAEKIIKISALFIILTALVMYWVVPNTKLAKRLKMHEGLFVLSCIVGMACGVIGLIATYKWQEFVLASHLFEFILILYFLIYVYWAMILKNRKTTELSEILDEKQIVDITKAVTISWLISSCLMIYFLLFTPNPISITLGGKMLALFYIFTNMFIISTSTLYYFKRT